MNRLILILLMGVLFASCQPRPQSLSQVKSRYATDDDLRIHYKTVGRGSQALVFVHGLGCDLHTWESQYAAFAQQRGLKLIFIDLPGFGLSSKPAADYTLSFFAEAIEEVLDQEHVRHAILVGHSLGTPVCRQYCFEHPRQVDALCDVDGVYVLLPADTAAAVQYQQAMQAFASGFCQPDVQSYFTGFVSSLAGPHTPQHITSYALSTMPHTPGYVACSTMRNLIDLRHWTGAPITVPTLVVCTQNSGLEPDNQARMQALYPSLTYIQLSTCGHFIHMEQPQLFNQALSQLVSSVRR